MVWIRISVRERGTLTFPRATPDQGEGEPTPEESTAAGLGGLWGHPRWRFRAIVGLLLAAVGLGTFWAVTVAGQDLARRMLDKWSETQNVVWKTRLPGPGSASPITVGDVIFVTCYSGYAESPSDPGDQKNLMRHVVCIDRESGAIRWTKDVKPELPESAYRAGNDGQHGYASSTPVSDGKNLFVFFGKSGVFCFDTAGC